MTATYCVRHLVFSCIVRRENRLSAISGHTTPTRISQLPHIQHEHAWELPTNSVHRVCKQHPMVASPFEWTHVHYAQKLCRRYDEKFKNQTQTSCSVKRPNPTPSTSSPSCGGGPDDTERIEKVGCSARPLSAANKGPACHNA